MNVRAVVTALADAGFSVDLLTFPYGHEIEIPGVRILRSTRIPGIKEVPIGPSWRKIVLDIFLFVSALRYACTKRYFALHGIEEGGIIAVLLGKFLRTRSVFDMDSCMVTQLKESGFFRSRAILGLISLLERFSLRHATAIVTVCRSLTEKARAVAPEALIYQIEDCPIDADLAENPELEQAVSTFLKPDRPCVLYTGNFESYQGIELLLEAFQIVSRAYIQTSARPLLVLVGGEPSSIARLKIRVAELELHEDVVLTGARPLHEMPVFMERASVLVSPRLKGSNTPLKIYTYMATGKIIVATKIESHTQVLDDGCALLAEPSPQALSAALLSALDQTTDARMHSRRLGERAREIASTRFSRERFDGQFRELYRSLAGTGIPAVVMR